MTEPGPDGKVESAPPPKRGRRWFGPSVSWKVIIATVAVLGLAVAIVVAAGGVSVSADKPDGWLVGDLLHFVFKRSIASRANGLVAPPDLASPSRVRLAAQHFDMVCANCHGRPGFGQSMVALSMNPRPQYLPKVLGQFTDAELYAIVEHGVKYSAMPSWPTDRRGDEVWSMVAFLRQLPKLDAKTYGEMTALPSVTGAASGGSGDDGALRPANASHNTAPTDEFLYAAPTAGFSDQTVHQNPVATCARCHGADGSGAVTGGEAPNLTLQDAAYLQATLEAYTKGSRRSGFMQNIASQLSASQIAALSHYYADLPVQAQPSPPADPALIKRGETIATQGIRESATPACASCHESTGSTITHAPHIAGQSQTFLLRQLAAMAHGGRGSTLGWNPMPAVAHDLSKADIAALAAYYSGLKPAKAANGAQQAPQPTQPSRPAANDLVAAKQIFEVRCVQCHEHNGRGDLEGEFPNLTLQTAPFVAQNLYAFHWGARPSDKMSEVTEGLTLDQMASLAAYVNGLPPQPAMAIPDARAAARGAAIATHGAPGRGVPACLSCHSATGVAALPLIPRLQGQSEAYLRSKLDNFAKPYGKNLSALNPMPSIASPLTERERADLAAYFAAAAPLEKPAARP